MQNNSHVGYKNPPIEKQFKPGVSGNRNGRPKGTEGFKSLYLKAIKKRITLKNGDKISKRQAFADQLANGAVIGDPRKMKMALDLENKIAEKELGQTFLDKLLRNDCISEFDVDAYIKGKLKIPKMNIFKINTNAVSELDAYLSVKWLETISEIDNLEETIDASFKIMMTVAKEAEFWMGVEESLGLAGIDIEKRDKIFSRLEKTRKYKKPTVELFMTSFSLYLSSRNHYNFCIKTNIESCRKKFGYKLNEKSYYKAEYDADFVESKLKPEQIKGFQNYLVGCENIYIKFLDKKFDKTDIKFELTKQSVDKLFDWYGGNNNKGL